MFWQIWCIYFFGLFFYCFGLTCYQGMAPAVWKKQEPCNESCTIEYDEMFKKTQHDCGNVGHYICNTNFCNDPETYAYEKNCKDDECLHKCLVGNSCDTKKKPEVKFCDASYANQCYMTKNDGCYYYSCDLTKDEKNLLKNNNIMKNGTGCVETENSTVCQCQGKGCNNIKDKSLSCYESANSGLGVLTRCNKLTQQCLTAMNMTRVVFRKCGLMNESEKDINYSRSQNCSSSGCNNEFYCDRMTKSQSWTLIDAELNPLRFKLETFDEYFFQFTNYDRLPMDQLKSIMFHVINPNNEYKKLSLIIGNNNDKYVLSENINEKITFIQIRFDKPFLIEFRKTKNESVETKTWIKKNPAEAVTHFAFFAEPEIQIWRILARGWNMDNSNFEQYRLIHKSKAENFESASCANSTLLVQFSLTSSNIAENYKFVFKSTTAIATVLVKFNEMVIDFSFGPLTHHITIKENNYDFHLLYSKTAVMFAYDDNFREFPLDGFESAKIIFDSNNDDRYDLTIYDYQRPNATCDFNCDGFE